MIILLVFHLKITFQTLGYLESYTFAFSIWVANLLNFSKARTFFSSSVSLLSVVVTVRISFSPFLCRQNQSPYLCGFISILSHGASAGCQPYSLASCDLMTNL